MYFVSYSSKDAARAYRIVEFLETQGIHCWIAPRDITPGTSYPAQIVRAIRKCDGFILVASSNVNLSNHINSEVARAFDQKKTIYPFMVDNITFSDDYIYYLGQIQWINAYDDFQTGLKELMATILQYPTGKSNKPLLTADPMAEVITRENNPTTEKPGKNVRIATFQDLTDLGMTPLDIAKRLVENDYNLYPGMVVENEGEPEQWAGYLSTYPDTFRYLINEKNEIIGNWSFLAVSEEIHAERLAKGELTEETFNIDETEFLLFPGTYVGYLLNLSVNIGYNSTANLNLLIHAFVDQLLKFAEDGIFFKEWYVNVFRRDHEAMYRHMGFKYMLDNKSFGKLYHLNCIPQSREPQRKSSSASSIFNSSKRLLELYYDHFVKED